MWAPDRAKANAEAMEKLGLKMSAIYCAAKVTPAGTLTHSPKLPALMAALKGHGTIVWLHIGGKGPAFDTLGGKDALVKTLRGLSDTAAANQLRIAFFRNGGYAHRGQGRDRVRDSVVTIDSSYSSVLPDVASRPPETAPVHIKPDEPLKRRVCADRSLVEVFVNGKQCVAVRVYPGREDSLGVSLRAQGRDATLKSLDAWQMKSIYRHQEQ